MSFFPKCPGTFWQNRPGTFGKPIAKCSRQNRKIAPVSDDIAAWSREIKLVINRWNMYKPFWPGPLRLSGRHFIKKHSASTFAALHPCLFGTPTVGCANYRHWATRCGKFRRFAFIPVQHGLQTMPQAPAFAPAVCVDQVSRARKGFGRPGATG